MLLACLQAALPYHVRVLVPCYNESLEIVGKTAMAALDAMLPVGCSRTVYICDDGKDAQKRKWSVPVQRVRLASVAVLYAVTSKRLYNQLLCWVRVLHPHVVCYANL